MVTPLFRKRAAWAALACLTLLACPRSEERASAPEETQVAGKASEARAVSSRTGAASAPPKVAPGEEAPERGCRVVHEQALGTGLGAARVSAGADGVWIASYARRRGHKWLARFQVAPGQADPRALPELDLGPADHDLAPVPPAVAHHAGALFVATVDERGALALFTDATTDAPERHAIATAVDRRFPPALRPLSRDGALLAWTEGDATGMRVIAATRAGDRTTRHTVTPLGHGASAPRFVRGEARPWLLMLDAHAGVSPLLIAPFSDTGTPGETRVERPVSQPYAPPSIVGIALPDHPVQVAYTAIGNAATAAVGLVEAGSTDPPLALLPGRGYALLAVDAVVGPQRAVFAMDAPQTSDKAPPLEVHVRVWDGTEAGEPLVLQAASGSLTRPALAFDSQSGLFALTAVAGDRGQLYWLRCDA